MGTRKVGWVQGFLWTCIDCNNRNAGELVEVDLQRDAFPPEMAESVDDMREAGMDADLVGLAMPKRVRCECGARYMLENSEEATRGK